MFRKCVTHYSSYTFVAYFVDTHGHALAYPHRSAPLRTAPHRAVWTDL